MPWCFAFRGDRLHCGVNGTATLMAKHYNQTGGQNIDRVLDASESFVIEHVAGYANNEQISQAFIKNISGGTRESEQLRITANGC